MPIKRAPQSPAASPPVPSFFLPTSRAKRYVAKAVKPEKSGARRTQTSLMLTGMCNVWRTFQMAAEVIMSPG